MSKTYHLEICANSATSALMAQAGGADRVELCQNLEVGGTTPSMGQVWFTRSSVSIGVHVLIRPRPGDFLYSPLEFQEMQGDILICKEAKCDGIVVGLLRKDGQVDRERMAELIELARPMQVTFHRAFDRCRDPFEALDVIIGLGCDRLLTSGMANTAAEGAETIGKLIEHANGRIDVMPGSGINAENIRAVAQTTGATSFHASAKIQRKSKMEYVNDVAGGMGDIWESDEGKVLQLADVLESL